MLCLRTGIGIFFAIMTDGHFYGMSDILECGES